jgi:hypothetical protein
VIARERQLLLELRDSESLRDYDAFAERLLDVAQRGDE